MAHTIIRISSLLLAIGIMLIGNGLQGTLVALRGVEEGFSEAIIGVIMAMYSFGFIAGAFVCPGIISRVRHIRTFSIMAAVCATAIVAMGLWVNPWVWGGMRFILGVCIIGLFMVTESWLNSQTTNTNRGTIFSVYTLINLLFLGGSQFLILTADISSMDLFAIAAALFSFSLVPVALTRISEPAPVAHIRLDIRHLYRVSSLGFMGSLIAGLLCSLFWSLGPLFARINGLSNPGIVLFMSTTILGGILFLWPIGRWSDRADRRQIIYIVSLIIVMSSVAAMLTPADSYVWISLCMFLFGAMVFAIYPLCVAHANDLGRDDDHFMITSNLLVVYGVGAAIGPLVGGWIMSLFGHTSLFGMFIAGGLYLAGYAWYWRKHGPEIRADAKILYVPLVRTSQAAVELEFPHEDLPAQETVTDPDQ